MKILYKSLMVTLLVVFQFTICFCSDINIVINHAIGSANGSIVITLDDNSNGPYTYVLTGPFNTTFTNSDITNEINNLPKGEYCLLVTNADGCTAEVCFEIKKCTVFKGRTFCHEIVVMTPHLMDYVMLVGHDDDGTLKGNTFNILTEMNSTQLDQILPSILETTDQETNDLLAYGTSPYLVFEQDELKDDDILFLYKYDDTGKLLWVYYAGENTGSGNLPGHGSSRSQEVGLNEVKINPNPVSDILNINLKSKSKYDGLLIYSATGQFIMEKKIDVETEFSIDVNFLNKGLYFIQFYGKENKEIMRFIKK